jgi:hypothetical protein
MKTSTIAGIGIVLILIGGAWYWLGRGSTAQVQPVPTNTSTTTSTTASTTNSDVSDLIRLTSPQPGTEITSPVTITGEARGTWYFEASFPVSLTDWNGKIIAQGVAQAQSDWMTTDFVPFKVTLIYKTSDISGQNSNKGTLILKKDNPSGLPENEKSLEVPVILR